VIRKMAPLQRFDGIHRENCHGTNTRETNGSHVWPEASTTAASRISTATLESKTKPKAEHRALDEPRAAAGLVSNEAWLLEREEHRALDEPRAVAGALPPSLLR
jgi:hypothetical protein